MPDSTPSRPTPQGSAESVSTTRNERLRCTNCGHIAPVATSRRAPACAGCGNSGFRAA